MTASFRPWCAPSRRPAGRKPSPWRRQLAVEQLEDRTLLSTYIPTTFTDGTSSHGQINTLRHEGFYHAARHGDQK